ncbi:MAG: cobalamin synthesis protein [Paenibacillaceae bacterium]|jgi:G3E family GTPase|nr:cobalamin synthesis protein [Paenibacillaceae bacterium]
MERPVPVYILAGFLGSGKTTLLTRIIRSLQEKGQKPAVVMNELGEVNLDGVAVGLEVPMAELLDGCICCTVQGDLGIAVQQLIRDEAPDAIFIEATGVANPMEILDGVTEASLYTRMELKGVITVADAAMLLAETAKATGKTYRLLEEQIRCASLIVLNKADLVDEPALVSLEEALRAWNPHGLLVRAVKSDIDLGLLDRLDGSVKQKSACACGGEHGEGYGAEHGHSGKHGYGHDADEHGHDEDGHGADHGCGGDAHDHHHHHETGHDHSHGDGHSCSHDHDHGKHDHAHHDHGHACCDEHTKDGYHHSHEHVMVYTRYLSGPIDSEAFEALVGNLPEEVYRAKGVLTFKDTSNRYLFQYAYRQADFMKITPQIQVPDVVVFIGEQIPRPYLEAEMDRLEREGAGG